MGVNMKLAFKKKQRPEVGNILSLDDIKKLRKEVRKELSKEKARQRIYTYISKDSLGTTTTIHIGKYIFRQGGHSEKLGSKIYTTVQILC